MKRLFALVLLAVGFTTSAHATPMTWTDTANIGNGHITGSHSWDYIFDLRRDGFNSATDQIDGVSLSINLADDDDRPFELPLVNSLPIFSLAHPLVFNFVDWDDDGEWSFLLLGSLSSEGLLNVTVSSVFGDFNLLGASLSAHGSSSATSVPEPGMLGLLGVGLLGMALSMRRRKPASR